MIKHIKFNSKNLENKLKGKTVKREEAIAVLKEIVEACNTVDYSHILLKTVEESEGFELHIKDHFDEKDFKRIEDIIQKRNLSMKKYDGSVVIYAPKHI